MIGSDRVLALVPARAGSKGLRLKNARPLLGKPLLTWPIAAALSSRHVDRVVVSTDGAELAEIAKTAGADAPFLRPAELATDTSPSIDFILHALGALESAGDRYQYLVLLEPTSPLTEAADVDAAIEQLVQTRADADAIVSISPLTTTHPNFAVERDERGLIRPYGGGAFADLPRRQDLSPVYALDGSLYISCTSALRSRRSFCHERTASYIMPRYKSFEVDDVLDLLCIEAIAENLSELEADAGRSKCEQEKS